LAAGRRSVTTAVPVDATEAGPWRVRGRITAGGELLEQGFEIAPPVGALLGDAVWFRAASAASAPVRPAAEPLFRRVERVRLEWTAEGPLDSRVARLLDRQGEPLAVAVTASEIDRDGTRAVVVDVGLAPRAEGDYLIELVAGRGATQARRLEAFRVIR
jgi:hypothetical protein